MEAAQHIAIVDHKDIRDLVGKYLRKRYQISAADSNAALKRLLDLRVGCTAAIFDRAVDNQISLPRTAILVGLGQPSSRSSLQLCSSAPVRLVPLKGRTKPTQTVPNVPLSHPRSRW